MLRTTLSSILLASAASVAYAAGPEPTPQQPVVMTPAAPVQPFWAGGYVGAQLGYAYSEFDIDLDTRPGDFDDDSVIGGIHAGYLWQVGQSFYLGPELQFDVADLEVTDSDTGDTASFENIARLKLIAGYEVGNGLVYGSAGVAFADFDSGGDLFDGFDGRETNYVIGIGYDHRIGDNWTVGGEYMYHHFNDIGQNDGDIDLNTVHIKASYRF